MLVRKCTINDAIEELYPFSRFTKPELSALLTMYDKSDIAVDIDNISAIETGWTAYTEEFIASYFKFPFDGNISKELERIGLWHIHVPSEKKFLISGICC